MIVYFGSISDPSNISFLVLHHWKYSWFHSIIKEWVLFNQIDNVEFNISIFRYIFDTEKKPLIITFSIDIILKYQIILIELTLVYSV